MGEPGRTPLSTLAKRIRRKTAFVSTVNACAPVSCRGLSSYANNLFLVQRILGFHCGDKVFCTCSPPGDGPERLGEGDIQGIRAFPVARESIPAPWRLTPDASAHGGLVLQLDGSAPIFSPRSTRVFMVSLMNTPDTGGDQSAGISTIRTSTWALRLSRAISAIAHRCRTAVVVAARVAVSRLRRTTATQFGAGAVPRGECGVLSHAR
jgi:hypothetical protein